MIAGDGKCSKNKSVQDDTETQDYKKVPKIIVCRENKDESFCVISPQLMSCIAAEAYV